MRSLPPVLLLAVLGLVAAASTAVAVPASDDVEMAADNDLDSVYNPEEELESARTDALEQQDGDSVSEYMPETADLQAKQIESTAAPPRTRRGRRGRSSRRGRRGRSSRRGRFLRFLKRLARYLRLYKKFGSRRNGKSSPMSVSGGRWRRRSGRRAGRRGRRFGRLIRRLNSLARLLDGLNKTAASCSSISERQRRSLNLWAGRLRPFLSTNSTTKAGAPEPAVAPRSLEDDEADGNTNVEYY